MTNPPAIIHEFRWNFRKAGPFDPYNFLPQNRPVLTSSRITDGIIEAQCTPPRGPMHAAAGPNATPDAEPCLKLL